MSSSLESVRDRIKELEELGPLSLVEEEELKKLREEESLLASEYEIQKGLEELRRAEAANDFAQNSKKVTRRFSRGAEKATWTSGTDGSTYTAEEFKKAYLDRGVDEFGQEFTAESLKRYQDIYDDLIGQDKGNLADF